MMSTDKQKYASPSDWLSALKQDEAWQSQLRQLQASDTNSISVHRDNAIRRIGNGPTFEFWDIHQHNVELAVTEVWEIAELSLPKLKIQVIGMLSMEWIEQQNGCNPKDQSSDVVLQLKPLFFGIEAEAKAFLESIQGMKPTQITDKVNQLVSEKKISELSKHRDLWKVLHDNGYYNRSESNWNMQVK